MTAQVRASAPDDPLVTVLLGGDAVLLESAGPPAPGSRVAFTATTVDVYPFSL